MYLYREESAEKRGEKRFLKYNRLLYNILKYNKLLFIPRPAFFQVLFRGDAVNTRGTSRHNGNLLRFNRMYSNPHSLRTKIHRLRREGMKQPLEAYIFPTSKPQHFISNASRPRGLCVVWLLVWTLFCFSSGCIPRKSKSLWSKHSWPERNLISWVEL